jgi:hypothetical protein
MKHFLNFADLRDQFLSTYLGFYPTFASTLGLHQYDNLIEDYSVTARSKYLDALLEFRKALAGEFSAEHRLSGHPDKLTRLEYLAITWKVNDEIFRLTEFRDFEWNPMIYNDLLELSHLLDRDFAPLQERLHSVVMRLRAYPRVLANARQNLKTRLDRTIVEVGLAALEGRLEQVDRLSRDYLTGAEPPSLLEDLSEATQSARMAIASFIQAVRDVVLPNALYDSFRLGAELLERYIHSAELVDESLDSLREKGKREMDRLTVKLMDACASLEPGSSPREVFNTYVETEHFNERTILQETSSMLERIRAFVIRKGLVSIPSEVRCKVEETPPHMRWAFAAMNSPGAFEKIATDAYYYVTLPDREWDDAKRKEYLHSLNRSVLEVVSIHEAYPGHYTHFLHLQNIESRVGKSLWSYAFLEGWAHYTEEMMIESGYGEGDARIQIAYIQEALIRLCRYTVSIELHSHNMTLAEAQHLFEEKALMRPVAARKEAERAVFDPGYLFYTLGKFQIRELRTKLERNAAERASRSATNGQFSLYDFHNELLSYGSVPLKIISELMA